MIKVVVLGDAEVGKTAIMQRWVSDKHPVSYKATIGADFMMREFSPGVICQLWDTAGQARFQALGVAFYRGARAFVCVCDGTRGDTLPHLVDRAREAVGVAGAGAVGVIVVNKSDDQQQQVTASEAARISHEMSALGLTMLPVHFVSARSPASGQHTVGDVFSAVAAACAQQATAPSAAPVAPPVVAPQPKKRKRVVAGPPRTFFGLFKS